MKDDCAIHHAVDLIAKRWTLLIILEIHKGKKGQRRFSELKKSLSSITPKMLAARLREMEKDSLITKRIDATDIPVKSIYSLTLKGEALISVLMTIKRWSLNYNPKNKSCKIKVCKSCQS
jgi:DNA-binding HxlR family transcriptional regulator